MSMIEPLYLTLLRQHVEKLKSIQNAADDIGISRTSASLLLSGKYTANTDKIATKIIAALTTGRFCPHLQTALSEQQCALFANRALPTSDARALRHWHACRNCEYANSKEIANVEQ